MAKRRRLRSGDIRVPRIWPGDAQELFAELDSWDFWPEDDDEDGILSCDFESLVEVADRLWMASPFHWNAERDPFSFLASSSLSGAGNPCAHPSSRLARARNLGRFASLYANTVLIRDPFEPILYGEDSLKLRADFSVTLELLELLRPEIDAGVIAFAPATVPLCKECSKKRSCEHDAFWERLTEASDAMMSDVLSTARITAQATPAYEFVSLDNISAFVPAENIDIVPLYAQSDTMRKIGKLTDQDRREIVNTWIFDPSLADLQFRNNISGLLDLSYLTDRPIDCSLLWLLDDPARPLPPETVAGATHALPFIDGLDSDDLLKLRREEGEAFDVYRDRVKQLLEQAPFPGKDFQSAFRDLVAPELHKIDKAVASARKMVKRKVREQLVFGSGMVTIGLAAHSVAPEIGAILSAFGGTKFVSDLLSSLNTLASEPPEARSSDFFFLWKAQQRAKGG